MPLSKMNLKVFILLSTFSIMSCQTEMQEGGATIAQNVSPYTEEISTSIIEVKEGVTQLAESASESILEGTKEFVETASSSLKEAGQKIASEEDRKSLLLLYHQMMAHLTYLNFHLNSKRLTVMKQLPSYWR